LKEKKTMKRNMDSTINRIRQAMAGIAKHFASTPTLALGGTQTTTKDAVATLQGAIDSIDAAAAAGKAFHEATAAQHAAIAKGNALLKVLKTLVESQLGSAESVLGDFGFTNPKPAVPDQAAKAAAVAKRAATRAARHTMGKKQRAAIKGTVTAPAATPPATPAAPAKPAT
jgi:hypothetical protein